MLIIYLSAVAVAIALRRQERRHQVELALAYERLGQLVPLRRPKLSKNLSWANLAVGGIVAILGAGMIAVNLAVAKDGIRVPPDQWEFSAAFLATGFTLCILGVRSLQDNRRYEQALKNQART